VHEATPAAFIERGKPWQNGSSESANGEMRDECLAMQWLTDRIDTKVLIGSNYRHGHSRLRRQALGDIPVHRANARVKCAESE
jgi:putative transposase